MVAISTVRNSNASLKTAIPHATVAIFVGATSGIGENALKQYARYSACPTTYLVARNEASATRINAELRELNSAGRYEFIQSDVSLLRNVDQVCADIEKKEKCIDLLCMSAGFLTFGGRQESVEGLDKLMSLLYYSRIRFVQNLFPLLERSSTPRVVSIFGGGKEGAIDVSDLDVRAGYSFFVAARHSRTMTTLAFERLGALHPRISFCHVFPGVVKTKSFVSGFSKPVTLMMKWVVLPLMTPLTTGIEEVGQRSLFAASSERYRAKEVTQGEMAGVKLPEGTSVAKGSSGETGSGVYLVDWNGETVQNKQVLKKYREDKVDDKIMQHTLDVLNTIERGDKW
ncbi:MAG: hypothetical protein M1817_004390 [Caeruleum heppii]|nr:MAG: hypothetical protein M1817_004390 [Caeruleum heppii]